MEEEGKKKEEEEIKRGKKEHKVNRSLVKCGPNLTRVVEIR